MRSGAPGDEQSALVFKDQDPELEHLPELCCIDDQDGETSLQQMRNWLPECGGALDRDVGDIAADQPRYKVEQLGGGRAESAYMSGHYPIGSDQPRADDDRLLMN